MILTRFDLASVSASPWKNGGGLTREIVRSPAHSTLDTFAWRASIAEMSKSGAFSPFPGVDRVIVLLNGAGAVLRSGDGVIDHRLDRQLSPFSFPGEAAVAATLVDGSSTDFNVMTRRDAAAAELRVIRSAHVVARSTSGVLLSIRGEWMATIGSATESLSASCGVWWDGDDVECRLIPAGDDAALIAVRVWRVSPGGTSA